MLRVHRTEERAMVISLLLLSESWSAWEHRIGAFFMACRNCGQPSWQLTYRMYQTKGTAMSPPGPNDWPQNERFQLRCATCAAPTPVNHPSTWVPHLGVPFQQESYPVTAATPAYFAVQPQM
jgi:hypothetical protein